MQEPLGDSDREWIGYVQMEVDEWRKDVGIDATPVTQAGHTTVEAGEVLDVLIKGDTYEDGWTDDDARNELMEELGDVMVAHLGTMSLLGLRVEDCIEAALEKNGDRDWDEWTDGGHRE